MKLIGCDRCRAIFPPDTRYVELRILDATDGVPAPGFEIKELCPVCRADLDAFLAGDRDIASRPDPITKIDAGIVRARPNIPNIALMSDEPVADDAVETPEEIPTHKRQAEKRTCESCGHTGFRKFQKTPTGWCCWRCIDSQKRQLTTETEPEAESDPEPEPETPQAEESNIVGRNSTPNVAKPLPAAVTARCQDCTRTWQLTGFVLEKAAEMHELKHGHIVKILDNAGAA